MKDLLDLLKDNKVLLSDGAWGTMLFEKGLQSGDCPELWNISHREKVFEVAKTLINAGVDVIGTNCGNGFDGMIEISKEIRAEFPDIPLLVQANAGMPQLIDGKNVFPESPEEMTSKIPLLIDLGVNIIGGCCGTTPAYISAFKKHILNRRLTEDGI